MLEAGRFGYRGGARRRGSECQRSTTLHRGTRSRIHSLLEHGDLLVGKGVRLGNDRDEVDLLVQSSHKLDIDGLKPGPQSAELLDVWLTWLTSDQWVG